MNTITIDLNLLSSQSDSISNSGLDEEAKEGILNMFSAIMDIAEEHGIREEAKFVLVED